jgi:hypothetical protein
MSQGPPGPQGYQGFQGAVGDFGSPGVIGDVGLRGGAGRQGDFGVQGPKGLTGDIGPNGFTGPRGPQGYTGMIGPMGKVGNFGPMGPPGGSQGPPGKMGPTGVQGYIGFGSIGGKGFTGVQGAQGVVGDMGSIGPPGPPGPPGNIGIPGTNVFGPPGDLGKTGIGPRGPSGTPGTNSVNVGPQGNQGKVGPRGSMFNSAPGVQGAQGDSNVAVNTYTTSFPGPLIQVSRFIIINKFLGNKINPCYLSMPPTPNFSGLLSYTIPYNLPSTTPVVGVSSITLDRVVSYGFKTEFTYLETYEVYCDWVVSITTTTAFTRIPSVQNDVVEFFFPYPFNSANATGTGHYSGTGPTNTLGVHNNPSICFFEDGTPGTHIVVNSFLRTGYPDPNVQAVKLPPGIFAGPYTPNSIPGIFPPNLNICDYFPFNQIFQVATIHVRFAIKQANIPSTAGTWKIRGKTFALAPDKI